MGDIIIFALLAAFVISRLFKVLGDTNYDHDVSKEKKKHYAEIRKTMQKEYQESRKEMIKEIDILSGVEAELDQSERDIFDEMRKIKPTFTADEFLEGAKSAFEMIINAFSHHDKKTLKALLGKDIYDTFSREIDRRKSGNQKHETTLVSIEGAKIESVKKEDQNIVINVEFKTEQINIIRDLKTDEIIGGNSSKVKKYADIWTFQKPIKSRDNLWQLIETERRV